MPPTPDTFAEGLRKLRRIGDHPGLERQARTIPAAELESSEAGLELVHSRILFGHFGAADELCQAIIQRDHATEIVARAKIRRALLQVPRFGHFGAARELIQEVELESAGNRSHRRAQVLARLANCQLIAMERIYLLRGTTELVAACSEVETVARAFEDLGQFEDALTAQISLGHFRSIGPVSDPEGAREAFEKAIQLAQFWQLPAQEGEALLLLGGLLLGYPSSRHEGLENCERAREVFSRAGHLHGFWDVERLLAERHIQWGDDATEGLMACEKAYSDQDHLRWLESVLATLATCSLKSGRTHEALSYSEKASRICQRMGSVMAEIAGRLTIADFYARNGEYSKAIQNCEVVLEKTIPPIVACQVRQILATVRFAAKDMKGAESLRVRVLADCLALEDVWGASIAALNLASTYLAAGRLDAAKEILAEWIQRDEQRGAYLEAAEKHCLAAQIEVRLCLAEDPRADLPWPKPWQNIDAARRLIKGRNDPASKALMASTYQVQADFFLVREESSQALEAIAQAIEIYREIGYTFQAANSSFMMGLIHYQMAVTKGIVTSFSEAERALGLSLQYYENAGVHGQAQQARYLLAQLVARSGPLAASPEAHANLLRKAFAFLEAYENADRAARLSLVLRPQVALQEARLSLVAKEEIYRFAIDAALYAGDADLSLQWLERRKSRVFLEALASTPLRSLQASLPSEFLQKEAGYLEEIRAALSNQRAFELTTRLEAFYDEAQTQLGDQEYLRLRCGLPLDTTRIRGLLANPDPRGNAEGSSVVLAEYFVRDHDVLIYLIDPLRDGIRHFSVPIPRKRLETFVRMALTLPLSPRARLNRAAPPHFHQFDELIAPLVENVEPGDVICLVPHSELHALPLHALQYKGEPLIARHPVAYSPSASALSFCQARRRTGNEAKETLEAVVFGDPTCDSAGNRACAIAVAKLLGATPVLGEAATAAAFRSAAPHAEILHFQGHAIFDPDQPLDSALCLARGELLRAREIFDWPSLSTRLVSLGACQTGQSELRDGDELIGLVRAFLLAGSPSVLATLWPVHSDSTTFFMERFYDLLLGPNRKLSKAQALRQAMLETRSRWPEVYHWAPFVLVGDWQ